MEPWDAPWISPKKRGLRSWVLLSIGQSPKNGAERMDETEHLSRDRWRPSPGSIYPLLEDLAAEGHLPRRPGGRYELTRAAREHRSWAYPLPGVRTPDAAIDELRSVTSFLEDHVREGTERPDPVRDQLRELPARIETLSRRGRP